MIVRFANEGYDCRHLQLLGRNLRIGDFVLWKGNLHKVEAVQKDCPRIENLRHRFTMITLKTATGDIVPVDSMFGTREVFRPTRKVA